MIDDRIFRENGKFKKGHPGFNQHTKPPPPDQSTPTDTDADTDFDAAILAAAQQFGTTKKPKVGLAGYCASLRDTRPQDFAMLVAKATARRSFAQEARAAAVPITVEIVPCPANYFIPGEEARALWSARTGERPVLVIDNNTIDNDPDDNATPDDDTDPDDLFSDDPDDAG